MKISFSACVLTLCFVMLITMPYPLLAQPSVSVESADPASGEQDTVNLDVTIRGKGFKEGSTAWFLVTGSENPGGVTVHSTRFINSRTLISNVSIAAGAIVGGFDIEVLANGRRGKGIDLFKVVEKSNQNDTTPPDAVGSLQVDSFDYTSANVSWTASGDDGMTGTASEYQIRYLPDVPLTEANWETATPAIPYTEPIPTPSVPGTLETFELFLPESETYYSIGVRVLDDAGNLSALSVTDVTTAAVPPSGWTVEMVDYGSLGTMALDSDGYPGIAYGIGSALAFARWNGVSWDLEVVDGSTRRLGSIDLKFSSTGEPGISYDANHRNLSFAQADGSNWALDSLAALGRSSVSTALVFDDQGKPMIAYRSKNSDLATAHFNGSGWDFETVDQGVGARYIAMAQDSNGNPAIAYSDDIDDNGWLDTLKLAEFDGVSWSTEIIDSGVPQDTSGIYSSILFNPTTGDFVLADLAEPAQAGDSWGVRYLRRDNQGQWVEERVAYDGNGYEMASGPSLAVDSSGIPHMAFQDIFGSLYFASRTGDPSEPWVIEFVHEGVGDPVVLRIGMTQAGEKAYIVFPQNETISVASKLLSAAP